MSNEKSMSIDEMIANGASLPEIQKQLTRKVAARDEAKLAEAREKKAKVVHARNKAVASMLDYLSTLGIPCGEEERAMTEDMFAQIEKEMSKYGSIFESLDKVETKVKESNEPDDWDWLVNMVKRL